MKEPISKKTAETRVIRKYHKLYGPLIDLISSLQTLEPGGTLVDDVTIIENADGSTRIAYVAKPVMLTISEKNRTIIMRVIEADNK